MLLFQQFQQAFVVKPSSQRVQGPTQRSISLGDLLDEGMRASRVQFDDGLTQLLQQLRRQRVQLLRIQGKPRLLRRAFRTRCLFIDELQAQVPGQGAEELLFVEMACARDHCSRLP